jgi:hypothetical protein
MMRAMPKSGRGQGIALGAVSAFMLGAAIVLGARTLPHAKVGDVDPLSAVIALAALAVGVWAGYMSLRALRWQETNVEDAAKRLVDAVRDDERTTRRQLLGGHDRTINVDFTFRPAPAHDAQSAAPTGDLEQVVSYYQALRPGRMVITGAPGAGKTVLAVQLILGLVKTRQPDDPVPVRLSAASWDTSRSVHISHSVEAWLVEHLIHAYRLPPATAAALVTARMVLPVIDGLDEMDPDPQPGYDSRAAQALQALNAYQNDLTKADLVLTCRSGQYQALEAMRVWAEDAAQVQIEPVPAGKAHQFIHGRVNDPSRWQKVLNSIDDQPTGTLAMGLSTPWRLTLAATVYEHRDPHTGAYFRNPDELADPALDTPDAVRDHLLELFIPTATGVQQAEARAYSPDRVRGWLTTLATYLNGNATAPRTLGGRPLSGTDIVLHELWPLAGTRRPRAVTVALLAAVWLIAAPLLLMEFGIGYSVRQIFGASGAAVLVIALAFPIWAVIWPEPSRIDFILRTRTSRRKIVGQLLGGLAGGLVVGLAIGLLLRFWLGFASGLVVGIATGLVPAIAVAITVEAPGKIGVTDPRRIVRNDLTFGLVVGLVGALGVGVLHGLLSGLVPALVGGLGVGLTIAITVGLAGFRYVALLLCTRKRTTRWLPWKLGAFLDWCYTVGLMRKAGIAYQFRHRELQDYLARNQTP